MWTHTFRQTKKKEEDASAQTPTTRHKHFRTHEHMRPRWNRAAPLSHLFAQPRENIPTFFGVMFESRHYLKGTDKVIFPTADPDTISTPVKGKPAILMCQSGTTRKEIVQHKHVHARHMPSHLADIYNNDNNNFFKKYCCKNCFAGDNKT